MGLIVIVLAGTLDEKLISNSGLDTHTHVCQICTFIRLFAIFATMCFYHDLRQLLEYNSRVVSRPIYEARKVLKSTRR